MFLYHMRFQIAAALFYIIILYDYLKSKKLPLKSTKCFTFMLVVTGINLCFDMLTVYTIFHIGTVPPILNRLCHQIFIGTLLLIMALLYLYVEILANGQRWISLTRHILTMLPFVVTAGIIIFGELYYKVTPEYAYSYGPMAIALYLSIVFYIGFIIVDTFIYRKIIGREKCISIRIGIMIWVIAALVQYLVPSLLLSGLAVVLMLLFIYLSFENPKEYMDETIGTLNNRAFHLMLAQKREAGKPLLVISVIIEDFDRMQALIGHEHINQLLAKVAETMNKVFQTGVYHYRNNAVTVIVHKSRAEIEYQIHTIRKFMKESPSIGQYGLAMKSHIDIVDADYCKCSCDELYEIMNYMAEQTTAAPGEWVHELNDALMERKSRFTTIEKILHRAIEEDGFYMVYQPIYHVKDGTYHSAEALVRLKDNSTVGYISPEEFIRIAEKKGMMKELGNIVFDKVCRFFKENTLQRMGIEFIDVNLSGFQFMYPDLHEQFREITMGHNVSPGFFNLEITETAAVETGTMFQQNMSLLRGMGFSFSMDDFGTGYSNLSKMADIVYDLVKLDKSLLWPCFLEKSSKSQVILENVIQMLSKLDVKIVAEGVETREMADYLMGQGVNYLQGFYYARPLKEEDFLQFLYKNNNLSSFGQGME